MSESVFYMAKMDCPTEEQLIRNRMKHVDGVEKLDFDLMRRRLTVTHSHADDTTLLAALTSLSLDPKTVPLETDGEHTHEHPAAVPRLTWILSGISGITAAAAEIAAWTTGKESSPLVIALALLSIALGGRDTLRKGWLSVRNFTLNINFLMTVAIVGAVAIGQWPEAAMVTFLFGVAEMIEALSLERARNAISSLMEMTPETAAIRDDSGQWIQVNAADVQIGQIARVKPGERIPLDGEIVSGSSAVNQAPITGESMPVEKKAGDPVFAGTVNERGAFEFRITANKGNTTLARIIHTVQEAQSERAPTQRFVDSFAHYYTPAVVVAAVLVASLPPLLFHAPFSPWLYKALVMLVIACPCALVISTPVTIVSGLAAAAKRGILIKGGVYLEQGRRIKAIALDKTGTLTHGKPVVTDVIALNGQSADELLHWTASLDAQSEHPVASAIVAHCVRAHGDQRCSLLPVTNFEAIAGKGVKGRINGRLYYVGNHRLVEENGVCGPHVEEVLKRLEQEGKTVVVLTSDTEALAVLAVADTLRETSASVIHALHALGLRTIMLTGDNDTTARAIAAQAGIDDVRGNLLPEDKLSALTGLLDQYGGVGMVGDGINDAPALAKATLGFAMGSAGTGAAIETADVSLMQDDLRNLPVFISLSRQTTRILTQNIALALSIKAVFFALALAGHATLWMAVFADLGASLLVVSNGMRILRASRKHI